MAAELPPIQQKIFRYVFLESRSHIEAYELLSSRDGFDLRFREFLQALNATYRALSARRMGRLLRDLPGATPALDRDPPTPSDVTEPDTSKHLSRALAELTPEVRLAVQLFVIDEMSAAEVARIVGWPGPKTVYNRVARALAALRAGFARRGIGFDDF